MNEWMWVYTTPLISLFIRIGIWFTSLGYKVLQGRWPGVSSRNPFCKDARQPRKPFIRDREERRKINAQEFSLSKVPPKLDAIVIGSGIGGLSTAAILAKAGKRVLVLEQHQTAGGCCHTFQHKPGFEFDVGIHYVGGMNDVSSITRTLSDQISQGQLQWEPMDFDYDVIVIGSGDNRREYSVPTGFKRWRDSLLAEFPEEQAGIDRYFELMVTTSRMIYFHKILKMAPLWLVRILSGLGMFSLCSVLFKQSYNSRTSEVIQSLTRNKDLRTILTYSWADYGTPPSKSIFGMQALLNSHYSQNGAAYPRGGASEIALSIIPVIEAAGGKVLVKANVTGLMHRGSRVTGVRVNKDGNDFTVMAKNVISSAGVYHTFMKLLPRELANKSYYTELARKLKPSMASMSVFLGLNMSNKELDVLKQNFWVYTEPDSEVAIEKYLKLSQHEATQQEPPLIFVSFPSVKDPEWANDPQKNGKSTCVVVSLANWDWFEEFDKGEATRSEEYKWLKNELGARIVEKVCNIFPQIRNKIDSTIVGTPITNKHAIAAQHGEIYGLDHSIERFDPLTVAQLRPKTDIPGLYLTGQDVLTCGFAGALFAGVLTAQDFLERNVFYDLGRLHASLNPLSEIKKKKIH